MRNFSLFTYLLFIVRLPRLNPFSVDFMVAHVLDRYCCSHIGGSAYCPSNSDFL
jgi:hypothetical protein